MQCISKENKILSSTLTQICSDSTKTRHVKFSTPLFPSDTSTNNDPFIVCLKEKSKYFYDSLANENVNRLNNNNNKFPLKKSTSEDNFPERTLQLQYAADIVNSGGLQKSLPKNITVNNNNNTNKKAVSPSPRTHYTKRVSGIGNPFETTNIEEEEDDAVRFIFESGILGSPVEIMGNAISGIFRRQSKATTNFQEPVNKEQVRSGFLSHLFFFCFCMWFIF